MSCQRTPPPLAKFLISCSLPRWWFSSRPLEASTSTTQNKKSKKEQSIFLWNLPVSIIEYITTYMGLFEKRRLSISMKHPSFLFVDNVSAYRPIEQLRSLVLHPSQENKAILSLSIIIGLNQLRSLSLFYYENIIPFPPGTVFPSIVHLDLCGVQVLHMLTIVELCPRLKILSIGDADGDLTPLWKSQTVNTLEELRLLYFIDKNADSQAFKNTFHGLWSSTIRNRITRFDLQTYKSSDAVEAFRIMVPRLKVFPKLNLSVTSYSNELCIRVIAEFNQCTRNGIILRGDINTLFYTMATIHRPATIEVMKWNFSEYNTFSYVFGFVDGPYNPDDLVIRFCKMEPLLPGSYNLAVQFIKKYFTFRDWTYKCVCRPTIQHKMCYFMMNNLWFYRC